MCELNLIHVESGVDTTPANTSQKKGIQTVAGRCILGIFKDIHPGTDRSRFSYRSQVGRSWKVDLPHPLA